MSDASPPPALPRKHIALHWQILAGLLLGMTLGLTANALASREVIPGVSDPFDQDANGIHDRLDWWARQVADPLGKVFLRLIFMVVIPLVFSALALAVARIGDLGHLGRIGLRTLLYTLVLSVTAVTLGILLVNSVRPGRLLPPEQGAAIEAQYALRATESVAQARRAKPLGDALLDIIPENPLQEMVGALDGTSKGNGMLAVMFFALATGAAMAHVPRQSASLLACLEGVNAVSMVVVGFAMRLAPVGVAFLVFSMTARMGLALLPPLAGFVATVLGGFALQLIVVYPLLLWGAARVSPWAFYAGASDALLMAFGTSSSNATLPTSLRVADENLRLPRSVAHFVLTIGATGNQNGTALYEGVVVLFLAQVFQVELTLLQQITVVLMSVLAGVGTAGIPGGSIPMIVVVLQSVGIPAEGIGIILGIDRFLDMCRTVLNVAGDLVVAACVSQGEADGKLAV